MSVPSVRLRIPLVLPLSSAALASTLYLLSWIDTFAWLALIAVIALWMLADWRWARQVARRFEKTEARAALKFEKRSEQAEAETMRLETVLSGMTDGLIVLQANDVIDLANQRAAKLFGVGTPDDVVGQPLLSLSRDPDLLRLVQSVSAGGEQARTEIRCGNPGNQRDLQVIATVVPGAGPGRPLTILVFHDVTDLKRLEAMRRDFVANVSHEIRTPLTAIRGYAETLRTGAFADPERAGKFLEVIERHAERLSRLTDDLLALSDLELGRASLNKVPMRVAAAIETAVDVVTDKAQRRQVTLTKSVNDNLPTITADSDRIVQLLVNLVDNAVKYTDAGGEVSVGAAAVDSNDQHWLELRVTDTGVGIPSRDLPRLTERFYRVDRARSRELGGTGLGLAIVKHIVQAHAGTMHIESEQGKGTTVRVRLPL